jgi:alpha-mannosidase
MAAAIMLLLLCTTAISATALPSLERVSRPPPPSLDGMPPLPVGTGGTPITNLTVFVLPHSHDDTGWQRTVDQYYNEQVRYIYDTVVEELSKNPKRKFIFVETAYFIRWWREQNAETQATTKKLFQEGQIEFVNGAWCMADDASPSADAQIDQATLGHRYIQFHWTPEGAGTNPGIFSHVLDTHYGAPELTYRGFHYHFEFEAFGGEGGGGAPGSQVRDFV